MSKFFLQILTGPDNQTYEPANAMALAHCLFTLLAAMAGVVLWLWKSVQSDKVPDLQAFGIGLAGVGGAVAAAIVALGIAQRQRGDAGASNPSP